MKAPTWLLKDRPCIHIDLLAQLHQTVPLRQTFLHTLDLTWMVDPRSPLDHGWWTLWIRGW